MARALIVHPNLEEEKFEEPKDVYERIEQYPRPDLIFIQAYEAMATRFHSLILHKWQHGIEMEIKRMLKTKCGGVRQLEQYTLPE